MIRIKGKKDILGALNICGSKSESNRLLILQYLSEKKFEIKNISDSKDTELMYKALNNKGDIINIELAGTAMRFLTAYFSVQEGREITLTGFERMKQRPIKELVEALVSLGADITYLEKDGFPPLLIKGKKIDGGKINLNSNISSQFITALMLIAPTMKNGLEINLKGKVVSLPYIHMSVQLLKETGIDADIKGNHVVVKNGTISSDKTLFVESDWSSASYYYSLAACSENANINLYTYIENSFQGDSELVSIYEKLGINTVFGKNKITLKKKYDFKKPNSIEINLIKQPDIAQTIAVTCFILKIHCKLTGLETLRVKETDRLFALKTELEKLGANVNITDNSIEIEACKKINSNVKIYTYNDHRMAMAFAPISILTNVFIQNHLVVEKSYPNFWIDLSSLGFQIDNK